MNAASPLTAAAAPRRIGFIGAGRLGQTLACALLQAGLNVVAASSRDPGRREELQRRCPGLTATPDAQAVVDGCDFIFLSVGDDAIAPVCAALQWRPGQSLVHCSGATEVAALDPARRAGTLTGGFHPLQTFSVPEAALASLPGCTVGIEAEGSLREQLLALARAIGCVPFLLPPGARPLYHASAHYVGPFLVALLREAADLWQHIGADEAQALQALLPLLNGTVAAARSAGLARGMAGCIARGDLGTLQRHLQALDAFDPAAGSLYRELSRRNVPLALQRGSLSPERALQVQALLDSPPDAAGPKEGS